MNFEATTTWKNALEAREGDEHHEAREHLRTAFMRFRDRVEPLANDVAISMPGYTDHSILHCDSLWAVTDVVAGNDYPLTPIEAFILGGAFLVHDLGMGLSATGAGGLKSIVEREEWTDLLFGMFPDDAAHLTELAKADAARNHTWDGQTDWRVKEALSIYLRLHHAAEAENILTRQWTLSTGEPYFLLEDSELRTWFGEWIGRIAKSHWQSVDELASEFNTTMNAPAEFPSDWRFDPLKLAGILRCSDAAHVDERRANPLHTPIRQPQGESEKHWKFQEKLMPATEASERLVYTSTLFPASEAQAWWLAWDTLRMVDTELRKVDALFADLSRPRLRAKSVAGVDTPERLSKFIRPDGWTPIDAKPSISNTNAVISHLGGAQLYGSTDRNLIVLRELVANALDATRLLVMSDQGEPRPVEIEIDTITQPNRMTIRDFGIGMSAIDMVTYLCDFGKSGWRSQTSRTRHPGAMSAGYRSTGQFGIGFYSAFMIAKQVVVRSRLEDAEAASTMVLEFPDGLSARPLMRAAKPSERLRQQGTQIELTLARDYFDDTVVSNRDTTLEAVAHRIRALALLADYPIELRLNGEGPTSCGGEGGSWTDLDGAQLFDVLVDVAAEDGTNSVVSETRRLFAERARPVFDSDGSKIGMLALDFGTFLKRLPHGAFRVPGNDYAGGFRTGVLHGVAGVLTGEPSTAARASALSDLQPSEIRRWFLEQVSLQDVGSFSESESIELAAQACRLNLILEEFPLMYCGSKLISAGEFRQHASSLDSVRIFDEIGSPITLPKQQFAFWSYIAEDLFEPSEGQFTACLGGHRSFALADRIARIEKAEEWPNLEGYIIPGTRLEANLWWRYERTTLLGAAIRILAGAWNEEIPTLLQSSRFESAAVGSQESLMVGLNGNSTTFPSYVIDRPRTSS